MKILLPVVVVTAIIAFVIGLSVKNSFISPFNASSEQTSDASASGQMSQDLRADLPELSGEAAPAGKTFSEHGNTYTSYNLDNKVVMSGVYRLSTYNVNFKISVPKNGGEVTGELSGTCEAKITGTAEKPDSNGNSNLSGQYSGACKPIPTLGFKTPASGTFTGVVRFQESKAEITVNNKEPIETGGNWFEMHF